MSKLTANLKSHLDWSLNFNANQTHCGVIRTSVLYDLTIYQKCWSAEEYETSKLRTSQGFFFEFIDYSSFRRILESAFE